MTAEPTHSPWVRAVPALFVLLWSTGFLGAKLGLPYAEPLTFLSIRMLIASALLLAFALLTQAPWPRNWRSAGHIAVAGLLVHALYLGGVFNAIQLGLPAGVAALIVGTQPLLTGALASVWLKERLRLQQWLGLLLGFAGVFMVVYEKMGGGATSAAGIVLCLAALLGITLGTLYQKRFCFGMDLRTGGVIQYAATAAAMGVGALALEQGTVIWSAQFVFALTWLVLVLSVGAVGLLYTLIRLGEASRVASLFYLTPPMVAIFSFLLFDERLGPLAMVGMAVVTAGVALVNITPSRR